MNKLTSDLKKITKFIIFLFGKMLSVFAKKSHKIIIIETFSPQRYAGNPKYLFEYLSLNTKFQTYWVTENQEIIDYLKSKNFKYITNKNVLKKIWITVKANCVIGSGSEYYNFCELVDKDALKICTLHGSGPKLTLNSKISFNENEKYRDKYNKMDYIVFNTFHSKEIVGKNQLGLPDEKTLILGSPKVDVLYDKNKLDDYYQEKKWTNKLFKKIHAHSKIIFYVPTYRLYEYDLPIFYCAGFCETKFNEFLEEENLYFIYSLHSMSSFSRNLKNSNRIQLASFEKHPLFDNIELMAEVDLMIGDYSTLSSDFAILNRPQLFVIPDYELNGEVKGYAENFKKLMPGKEIKTFDEFMDQILYFLSDNNSYEAEFGDTRSKLLEFYVDTENRNACKNYANFLNKYI